MSETPNEVIDLIADQQKAFFLSGKTLEKTFRKNQLIKLLDLVKSNETKISEALKKDLNKSTFDAWAVETGVIEHELHLAIRQLKTWTQPRKLNTPLLHAIGSSWQYPEPYGNTLIISPWNYPLLLALRPVIGSIAAGNTCIIKPSEHSVNTSVLLADMINNNFDPGYLYVVNAGIDGTQHLLTKKFNYIFFTGSPAVGKIIYEAAAKNLTPVTLELGGKNPCIIDSEINLEVAARRIAWGKFSNAGQTCVAPDYLILHAGIKEKFIQLLIQNLRLFYGNNAKDSADYGRIINQIQFNRLENILKNSRVIYGGNTDSKALYIEPTIIEVTRLDETCMNSEIFGPLLPVITYTDISEAIQIAKRHPDPLVCYVFTNNRKMQQQVEREFPAGDMCINDVVVHFGHSNLPIGGRGTSGIGKYQGKYNFDTFTHFKSVLRKAFILDLAVRYPPFNNKKHARIKKLFSLFFN